LPSLTIENYVKTIYQTCAAQGERAATTGQIAAALGVSPGTVTSMLKTRKRCWWPRRSGHGHRDWSGGGPLTRRQTQRTTEAIRNLLTAFQWPSQGGAVNRVRP
jgi:hypothetical protein